MPHRVLVVDDEANILLSLEFLMKKAGYDVCTARDGEEALAEMRKGRPDLVCRLFIVDGAKALSKAIRRTFGAHTPIQRCQIHKTRCSTS